MLRLNFTICLRFGAFSRLHFIKLHYTGPEGCCIISIPVTLVVSNKIKRDGSAFLSSTLGNKKTSRPLDLLIYLPCAALLIMKATVTINPSVFHTRFIQFRVAWGSRSRSLLPLQRQSAPPTGCQPHTGPRQRQTTIYAPIHSYGQQNHLTCMCLDSGDNPGMHEDGENMQTSHRKAPV